MLPKQEVVAMLLAGGQGSRLGVLTKNQAKPAVPFGGKYRIIDFPLSNCVNSGIEAVGVLTQYQPLELNEYIGNGQPWDLDNMHAGVRVLPPYQKNKRSDWYKGTANAIFQNIRFIERYNPDYVVVLSGDHIYKMDYSKMISFHKEQGADCTIAVYEVPMAEAPRFGILNTNEDGSIYEFDEKPKVPKSNLASMGIYVFNWQKLRKYLEEDDELPKSQHDFGKNILPAMLAAGEKMFAYRFAGYWKDVGTISSLWEANMEVLDPEHSGINLFDENWKIYSRNSGMTGHKISGDALVENSMITDGCRINGQVRHSILFSGVKVEAGAQVEDAVVMGSTTIKSGAVVKHCIVAENVVIGENAVVGAMPSDSEKGVATIGPGIEIGPGAKIGPSAMVKNNVKGGEEQW